MATLTMAETDIILAAAKAKVLEMGAKMSVSVVDPVSYTHLTLPTKA